MSDYEELRKMVNDAADETFTLTQVCALARQHGIPVIIDAVEEEGEIVIMTSRLFEEEKMDAKTDGYQDGWQTGYDQGHEEGRDRGREDGLEEARSRLW